MNHIYNCNTKVCSIAIADISNLDINSGYIVAHISRKKVNMNSNLSNLMFHPLSYGPFVL